MARETSARDWGFRRLDEQTARSNFALWISDLERRRWFRRVVAERGGPSARSLDSSPDSLGPLGAWLLGIVARRGAGRGAIAGVPRSAVQSEARKTRCTALGGGSAPAAVRWAERRGPEAHRRDRLVPDRVLSRPISALPLRARHRSRQPDLPRARGHRSRRGRGIAGPHGARGARTAGCERRVRRWLARGALRHLVRPSPGGAARTAAGLRMGLRSSSRARRPERTSSAMSRRKGSGSTRSATWSSAWVGLPAAPWTCRATRSSRWADGCSTPSSMVRETATSRCGPVRCASSRFPATASASWTGSQRTLPLRSTGDIRRGNGR